MRSFILFFFLSACLSAYSQKIIRYSDGKTKEYFSVTGKDSVKNGCYFFYFQNGTIGQKGLYINNMMSGRWEVYFENGILKTVYNFENNLKNGAFEFYFEDGNLRQKGNYTNNRLEGRIIEYFQNGDTLRYADYHNGLIDGEFTEFKENNIRRETFTFKNGKINGSYIKYFNSGQVSIRAKKIGDAFCDTVKSYYPNGNLLSAIPYSYGLKHGISKSFFENGNLMYITEYQNDIRQGEYTAFYSCGNIAETGQYKDGKREGFWMSFHQDGITPYTCGHYKEGSFEGLWRIFNQEGSLISLFVYCSGVNNGIQKNYLRDTKITYFSLFGKKENSARYNAQNGQTISSLFYNNNLKNSVSIYYNNIGTISAQNFNLDFSQKKNVSF